MPIRVQCPNPNCRKEVECPDEHAGRLVQCPSCGGQVQVPSAGTGAAHKAKTLGDYRIVRKIGEGGMGAVYEAEHAKLKRRVALKVLPQKFTQDTAFLERFYREAQSAAALNHPNVIQLYDIGEDRGHHFFGMEFVDGESVQDRLDREGKLALDWSLHIVRGAAEALKYAHEHAIIHRDIKPDNIMLTADGQVKLADLGLAKKIGVTTAGVTQDGATMGTPYYMAPEQAEDARRVDHRADIYALGITLLHLLTGKRPYEGESVYSIILSHADKPLPSGDELGTPLPPAVESVIQKMCAKSPDERYQDYETLLADLGKVEAGEVPQAIAEKLRREPTVPAGPRARGRRGAAGREKRKSKVPVIAGIGVLVALIGVGVFLTVREDRGSGIPSGASARSSGVPSGESSAPRSSGIPSGESSATDEDRQVQEPGKDSGPTQTGDLAAMLAYAEKYAAENPDDYSEIIHKYGLVKTKSEASVEGMKAADAVKSWQGKWDEAASAELEKRHTLSQAAIEDWRFADAAATWAEFPESLRVTSVEEQIKAELARIEEARGAVAQSLGKKAEPLLAKKPEELTQADLQALSALKEKAGSPPDGLPDEAAAALEDLSDRIASAIASYGEAVEAKQREAFRKFWLRYEGLIKEKQFDGAATLAQKLVVPPSGGSGTEEEPLKSGTANVSVLLGNDARLLSSVFENAKENLSSLEGKTVRIGGTAVRVSDVRGGRIYAGEGGVEMAFNPDRLGEDTLLKLGLASMEEPGTQARASALHAFYYRSSKEATRAMEDAKEAGEDVSFYLSRMTPILAIATTPTGATVELREMVDGEWVVVDDRRRTSPLREEVEQNATYQVETSKEGYESVTREVKVGEAGEHRVKVTIERLRLPPSLARSFEVPKGPKDAYGNPVRRGFDKETGLPLEIRHQQTGMHFVFIPPGEFLMGSPEDEKDRMADREGPVHKVRLTKPFYLGKYEVTQAAWKGVMGNNPSKFQGDRNPVETVNWDDCQTFVNRLQSALRQRSAGLTSGTQDKQSAIRIPLLPPHRSPMGIRVSGRHEKALLLRRRPRLQGTPALRVVQGQFRGQDASCW